MSVSLKVDDKGNLQIGSEIQTINGIDSLIQDIRTRLRLVQGEYHFDTTQGLPYFDMFLFMTRASFEKRIIEEILKDDRVLNAEITGNEFVKGNLNLSIEITTKENQIIRI